MPARFTTPGESSHPGIIARAPEFLADARAMAAEKWPQASQDKLDDLARSLAQAMACSAILDDSRSLREAGRVRVSRQELAA